MRFSTTRTLLLVSVLSTSNALVVPSQHAASPSRTALSLSSKSGSLSSDGTNVDDMKADIARMRQEALQRLESLNEQMHQAEQAWGEQKDMEASLLTPSSSSSSLSSSISGPQVAHVPTIQAPPAVEDASAFNEAEQIEDLFAKRMEHDLSLHFLEPLDPTKTLPPMPTSATTTTTTTMAPEATMIATKNNKWSTTAAHPQVLLEDTRWRLMLDVGRETGTWMPSDWGVSGDRLRMHLELEFSPELLYERDEFLNGVAGAKVLKVVHSEARLAPSMQEGGKNVKITGGGWRVAPNEGPMGTSVLRLYFDLAEQTQRTGSDVYCPAGRIYCTCGYFPMAERQRRQTVDGVDGEPQLPEKEVLRREMRQLEGRYEAMAQENKLDTSLLSWSKLQRSKKMMALRMHATKLNSKMHEAHVREPDKSHLRVSQDQSVGLTRQGGVCCKVQKGLAIEYHILGKFEVASMVNREHSDYKDLLP